MGYVKSAAGLLLFISVMSGCVHFSPRPIAPADSVSHLEQRSLDDPVLHDYLLHYRSAERVGSWPMLAWDSESLVLAAVFFRADMARARAQWAAARAAILTAGQLRNPVFGFSPLYNISSSNVSPWILPVTVDVPFSTAGKRSARVRRAEQLARSARHNVTSTAWGIRYQVQQALLGLQAAKVSAVIIQQQLQVQQELVKRMQAQLDAGEVSSFELAQSQSTLRSLQLAELDKERAGKVAEVKLASAIGLPAATLKSIELRPGLPDGDFPATAISEARREALVNRPDILSALAVYEAAQEKLQLEIARQYPNFNLGPGYEFDQDDNKWGLSFSMVLPVFNHNAGPIAEAEAYRNEAAAAFNRLQSRVIGEIDGAVVAFKSQRATVAAAEKLLSIARQQAERIRKRKAVGELSRLDELHAEAAVLKVENDLLQARVTQQASYYALENALQSPETLPALFTRPPAIDPLPVPEHLHGLRHGPET